MHKDALSVLACPSCRCSFVPQLFDIRDERVITAILTCPVCQLATPLIAGFPLFGETRPLGSSDPEAWLTKLSAIVLADDKSYSNFLQEKARRKYSERYAAFQPFNESTRSLYPFLPLLADNLEPGDVILDTWCRTGWSGELLAGLFPQQHVISIWEGNSNVLGYSGFAYWLGEFQRLGNLSILFTHPDHALPLADDSITVIHGLDSLHRYRHASYIPECLRVCRESGVLIFPHIHLTNSQPSPFFERGCQQYHGKEWKAWLDKVLAGKSRDAWILAEDALFEAEQEFSLEDQSDTHHYNALVLIAGRKYQSRTLQPMAYPSIAPESRFLGNPLVELDLHRCRVRLNAESLAGQASKMLERHPCYRKRLASVIGSELEPEEALFTWHALQGLCLKSIALRMQVSSEQAAGIGQRLCQRELLHPATVSRSMAELQNFYAFAELPNSRPIHFSALWESALESYGQRSMVRWLEDDSALQADEVSYLVDAVRARLEGAGLKAGSRILISCYHHPEALLICWAAWLQGMVTVIIDSALPREEIARMQQLAGC
ncbi:AMP-binding protein, partial [Pseudomonadota bacterium]